MREIIKPKWEVCDFYVYGDYTDKYVIRIMDKSIPQADTSDQWATNYRFSSELIFHEKDPKSTYEKILELMSLGFLMSSAELGKLLNLVNKVPTLEENT